MSLTRPLRLPNVSNVGKDQTATVNLGTGNHTYESVNLGIQGLKRDEIKNIEMRVNGKPIQSYQSIADLDVINEYYGHAVDVNRIDLSFYRQHLTSAAQARTFNIGVSDVSTCEFQLDINDVDTSQGNIGVAPFTPAIKAYAPRYTHVNKDGVINRDANRLGAITKVRHFTYASNNAGRYEISDLPREMFLQALHIKSEGTVSTECNITDVKLELDGQTVWDLSREEMRVFLSDRGRKVNDLYYHLDFMLSNEQGSQLSLAGLSDFRLILETQKAGVITVYPEYWSGIGGI